MKVQLFTTNKCKYCDSVKKFLKENSIEYTESNVSDSQDARKSLLELGYKAVPVTVIDGGDIVIEGFDESALREALDIS